MLLDVALDCFFVDLHLAALGVERDVDDFGLGDADARGGSVVALGLDDDADGD